MHTLSFHLPWACASLESDLPNIIIKVDYKKFMELAKLKTPASANACWGVVRKKLLSSTDAATSNGKRPLMPLRRQKLITAQEMLLLSLLLPLVIPPSPKLFQRSASLPRRKPKPALRLTLRPTLKARMGSPPTMSKPPPIPRRRRGERNVRHRSPRLQ